MKIENMFSSFKNSKGKTVGEIFLYGPIARGGFWESDENSCKNFLDQIRELEKTCSEIHVRINSEGGEVFEGTSIGSTLKKCSVPTICFVDGLCASIATVISSSCKKTVMCGDGIFMLHSPISRVSGNSHDMKEMAKILDKIEEAILETYVEKCGDKCSREEILELLKGSNGDGQGTWMTAKEALKYGFIDEIGHELKIAAQIDGSNAIINGIKMDLSGYQNLDKVREIFENKTSCNNNKDIKNDIEETNMSEKEKMGSIIDTIANTLKGAFGIKNEVEPEIEAEQPQGEEAEVSNPQEEDGGVQDEPSVQEEPVAEEEAQEEPEAEVDSVEETEPQQEEPETDEEAEIEPSAEPKELEEQPEPEAEPEIEPSVEVEDSVVPEVEANVDLVAQVKALTAKLEAITNADAEKAVKLVKAELSKEVEDKFKGVPGKLEDKVEKVYSIKNSNLEDSEKEFILNGLSLLSELNLKACQEIGNDNDDSISALDGKERKLAEAKILAEKEGISEGKALLVLDKQMTLEQAKKK